ncbi:DNA-binding domain-containing protein [Neptuniibacter sp.]|uniref:HvfC/BufC N-terminal domain-containing protein n=1 Tax=Neptuniibacter sp. TaxID=1962643 RepID=UPI002620D1DF|nr:DNA-binding domain-containing protein [Neptuniibacter sp.]MCP4598376.1 DUF2063 domain-containing protein [Neptuniibacter sp.]
MNLAELQADFQGLVLDRECQGAEWISGSKRGITSKRRLEIYHNAYRIRLIGVLRDTFEHTASYIGDDWFDRLAGSYVEANTSQHSNIGLYGQGFPEHLSEMLEHDQEVAELAHLDWTLRRAFDGPDADVLTREVLEKLAASGVSVEKFSPVPTLKLCSQRYNTLDIWHAINQDEVPPEVVTLDEPVHLLTWRKGHSPHFRSVSVIEYAALNYLCGGCDLEAIGEGLNADFPDADIVNEFGLMIARWLDDEILTVYND